jgi:[ribosomal protein S5]-alanine N-acetyltransferase
MEIVTTHLLLREFEESDYGAMLSYQSDERYRRYYPGVTPEQQAENTRKLLQSQLDARREQPRTGYQLVIALRGDRRMLGNVGVRVKRAGDTEGDMGCELAPRYWNRGYATEATEAMLTFGFEHLGLHRIWASTMAPNTGARRVLEKLGMTLEGELRETTLLADGWANSVIYGILDHEWRALREPTRPDSS